VVDKGTGTKDIMKVVAVKKAAPKKITATRKKISASYSLTYLSNN